MARFISFLVLAIYAFLLVSTETTEDDTELECSEDAGKLLEEGNAVFAGKFLHLALKENPNENQVMSAFSVLPLLAELALYAEGNTLDQLLNFLNLPTKCDIRCVFPSLISNLRAEQNVILNIASKIYSSDLYPLTQDFLDDTKEIFDSEADTINIYQPQAAADKINQWIESQTNNRIKKLASPDMITPDTRLVLANAIYFLGNWTKAFNVKNTIDREFHTSKSKSVKIPTMYQQGSFRYGEDNNLDCQVLEMTYKGGNFSYVVFLPRDIEGLPKLVEKLQDPKMFYNAYDNTRFEKVNVYIPKMKIESEYNLKDIMRKVGLVDILDPSKSNLTGIMEKYEPLYISAAKHKSFIESAEKGTEAAAANVIVGARPTSVELPRHVFEFRADRPFSGFILNKRNILFSVAFVTN